ncbi:MAG TPA: hypothetical protein PKK06_15715 [Phycisphaerae bacterium]|nr:hypothetical protein [Phycisphaerae bacterium]HNU46753.1 hypothetical protein [Phycisphaerae bacterium]
MAKQLVNPIERHAEKGVLAIAGLILIGVVARFLITSPNHIELSNESVTPGTIDEKIAAKAADVRQRLASHEPTVEPAEPLLPSFKAALDPFAAEALNTDLPPVAVWQPPVPVVDRVTGGATVELVDPVPLPKPIVLTGRSTFVVDRQVGGQTVTVKEPVNWATITSLFNRIEQLRRHKSAYHPGREDVVVLGTEIQRRALRPDGQWLEEDWVTVEPFMLMNPPKQPKLTVSTEGDRRYTPTEQLRALESYLEAVNQPKLRREVLRPLFPSVLNGAAWKTPLWSGFTVTDLMRQDDELLSPKEPPSAVPECLYPECQGLVQKAEPIRELTPQEKVAQLFKDAEASYEKAKSERSLNDAIRAQNSYVEIINNPGATGADKAKAKRLMAEAAQLERDIRREIDRRKGGGAEPGTPSPTTPTAPARALLPTQEVWAHDLSGGLRSGRTYQYRIRTVLLNQYAGQPQWLAQPEDAARIALAGPWSEPSDPVHIEPDVTFYLTTAEERGERVRAELYRWFEGVWVRSRGDASIGDVLRDESRVEVPIPGDPFGVDRPQVSFETGVMVLDIDFGYPLRVRKDVGRGGVKFDRSATSTVVTFVDDEGNVFERVLDLDLSSPDRKVNRDRVWRPTPKAEERPRPTPRPPGPTKGP